MSHQPLTDDELDTLSSFSPGLRQSYRSLRSDFVTLTNVNRDTTNQLEQTRREIERLLAMLHANDTALKHERHRYSVELTSLTAKLAARASEAECRARSDRSALLRMAGNIAGGIVASPGNFKVENVAIGAVAIARAIIEEVDKEKVDKEKKVELFDAIARDKEKHE
jgi:hypothetical protein